MSNWGVIFREVLFKGAAIIGLDLSEEAVNLCFKHYQQLVAWNKKFNLTRIEEPAAAAEKHYLDSFLFWREMSFSGSGIDVGSGAGFPGLPLKFVFPQLVITLLEPVKKKANFLYYVIDYLQLRGVEVLQERAETIGQTPQYREKFAWVVCRAVASLGVIAEYCLPLVRVGGYVYCFKGPKVVEEINEAQSALSLLGAVIHNVAYSELPFAREKRSLVVLKKVTSTPPIYPRRSGVPSRRPLGKN